VKQLEGGRKKGGGKGVGFLVTGRKKKGRGGGRFSFTALSAEGEKRRNQSEKRE